MTHGENGENTQQSSFDCDVLVVGAGPAGATAAYYLASAGIKVFILDKDHFPRERLCGDLVNPGSIFELQKMGITNLPEFKDTNVIDRAKIFVRGKEHVSGAFPAVSDLPRYSHVMSRKLLDNLILEAARGAGATVLEGYRVSGFQVDSQGVTVNAEGKEGSRSFRASLVIGGDGNNSEVARILHGAKWKRMRQALVGRGYFVEVAGLHNEAKVFFNSDSLPGYSWVFPFGKHEANVGVGVILGADPPMEDPKALITKFIASDAGMRSFLEHATMKGEFEVGYLNMHDPELPIVGNRVLLVGEAAGLINPYNGGGIQFALQSGKWAAEIAKTCAANGNFSSQALFAYSKRVDDELGDGYAVSELMLGLLRNRNLTRTWLDSLESMCLKSKTDPTFARLTSGILSGMIFPNQQDAAQALLGTFQEAALSAGVTAFTDILTDPFKLPQSAITLAQTGLATIQYAAQNPLGILTLGMDTAVNLTGLSATAPKQLLKDVKNKTENPAP
jgi:menaquinone-9 beta-reductase